MTRLLFLKISSRASSIISSAVVRVISKVVRRDSGLDRGGSEPVHKERLDQADEEEQIDSPFVAAGVVGRVDFRQDSDAQGLHQEVGDGTAGPQ